MSDATLIRELTRRRDHALKEVRTIDAIVRDIRERPIELGTPHRDGLTLQLIERSVEAATGFSRERLLRHCRQRRYAMPRQLCMYLSKRLTSCSYPQVGRRWERDHTTVIHACRAVSGWKGTDAELRDYLEAKIAQAAEEQAA